MKKITYFFIVQFSVISLTAQTFYKGADLSYINELEDCGVIYTENNQPKDPYQIFADHHNNLVRLRLWHTPSWYDNLNGGRRYADLRDVKKSIHRAKSAGMDVLLDFHLSDNWADPSKQVIPAAWSGVVDELPILKDSLYNYIYATLAELEQENLLPEMVQIGNETNRGILLSQSVNDAGWTLDWGRNSELFKAAIQAVKDIEAKTNKEILIMLHVAGPTDVDWFIGSFIANGVTDFDIIGISYYEQWHGKTDITAVGSIIKDLKSKYNKAIMVVEAGYPWTTNGNDTANNVLSDSNPNYAPLSPTTQKEWLLDLAQAIQTNGGIGLIYWEPAWVSSECSTQWGKGSHYENASFFDFNHNLQENGGIEWMMESVVATNELPPFNGKIYLGQNHDSLIIELNTTLPKDSLYLKVHTINGQLVMAKRLNPQQKVFALNLPSLTKGIYAFSLLEKEAIIWSEKLSVFQR